LRASYTEICSFAHPDVPYGEIRGAELYKSRPASARSDDGSGTPRELREVRLALGLVGLAALLRLGLAVEQQVSVVGQSLEPGVAVLMGVETELGQAHRPR